MRTPWWMVGFASFFLLIGAEAVAAQTAEEYAVKASFIAKFMAFVEWPPGQDSVKRVEDASPRPFVITILGSDPFKDALFLAFQHTHPDGKKVQIRTVSEVKDLAASQVIFISAGERNRLDEVVRWAREHGVLTIGDGDGFAERGVIINFYLSEEKIRFEINTAAAEKSGFQISSLLLKVARIVEKP